ncbi:MAG: hypothetical protein EBW68_00775 [Actinobacteria bacterium]|nr:hypothetical protein [Actinomycetota bacterium]
MGAYQQFVKAHYHDAQFKGMTPPQTIKAIATMWRSHKAKGGAVTAGKAEGGGIIGDLLGSLMGGKAKKGKAPRKRAKKGGSVTAGSMTAGKAEGGGFFGDALGAIF